MAWHTFLNNRFVGMMKRKLCGFFPCDRRTRECQSIAADAWDTYANVLSDTNKAFEEKEVFWDQAYLAMNEESLPIFRGINSRVMSALRPNLKRW